MPKHEGRSVLCFGSALVAVGAALAGCATEVADATVTQAETPESQVAEVVYEVAFSEMGRIQIYRDHNGFITSGVIGGIGKDRPEDVRPFLDRSVVKMFQNLRPGIPVPAELVEFDKQMVRSAIASRPETPRPSLAEAPAENADDFITTVCRNFPTWGNDWVEFWAGKYQYSVNYVESNYDICNGCGEWSYYWNTETTVSALHGPYPHMVELGESASSAALTAQPSDQESPSNLKCSYAPSYGAPGGTWGYHSWPSTYCDFKPSVYFRPSPHTANLGVTIHIYHSGPSIPPGAQ